MNDEVLVKPQALFGERDVVWRGDEIVELFPDLEHFICMLVSFFSERGFVWIIFFFLFEKINAGDGALIEVEGEKGWEVPFACEVRILGEFVACLFPVGNSFCKGLVMVQVCFGVVID